MKYVTPAFRISLGITGLVVCVIFFAKALNLIPDPRDEELAKRRAICEHLAINCSLNAQRMGRETVHGLIEAVSSREPEILAAGVRTPDGELEFASGERTLLEQRARSSRSSADHVRVPIRLDGKLWRTIEVRFRPIADVGAIAIAGIPVPRLIALVASSVFVLSFLFLGWSFRRIGQSADEEIPARVRATLDTFTEGILLLNKNHKIALANQAFAETVGRDSKELEGQAVDTLTWSDSNGEATPGELPWEAAMDEGRMKLGAVLGLQTRNGTECRFSVNSTPINDDDGECRGVLATFDDLTLIERRNRQLRTVLDRLEDSRAEICRQNEQLSALATRDPLTNCLNRRAFFEHYDRCWRDAKRHGRPLSCAMVDIDRFKSVNDRHGHAAGDAVLKQIADLFVAQSRENDVVCRYGGEEFVVLMPGLSIGAAAAAAEALRKAVEEYHPDDLLITVSVGVCSTELGAGDPREMLQQADEALYVAKDSGRNRVVRSDEQSEAIAESEQIDRQIDQSPAIPFHAVASLISALAHRDAATAEHSRRVADMCVATAQGLLSEGDCYVLEVAALLHDIGKLGVPDAILLKPGPLTEEEWDVMKTHDDMGVDITESAFNSPALSSIIANHHAWFEGSPRDAELPAGEEIPLAARILSIVDAFDAMVSDRVYRKGRGREAAFAELRRCAPRQFDPELVERFITVAGSHKQQSGDAIPDISKRTALEIGVQIERLAHALDEHDIGTLVSMAAQLKTTATRHRITEMAEVAACLEDAATRNQDRLKIAQLTSDLLDFCRATQRSYLARTKNDQPFSVDAVELVSALEQQPVDSETDAVLVE